MFNVVTLTNCYTWGWIDDAYLDRLVALGQISADDLPEIKGTKIVDINSKRLHEMPKCKKMSI